MLNAADKITLSFILLRFIAVVFHRQISGSPKNFTAVNYTQLLSPVQFKQGASPARRTVNIFIFFNNLTKNNPSRPTLLSPGFALAPALVFPRQRRHILIHRVMRRGFP